MSRCQAFWGYLLFIMLYIILCSLKFVWFPFPYHLVSSCSNCLNNSELQFSSSHTLRTLASLDYHFQLGLYVLWCELASAPRGTSNCKQLAHFCAFPFTLRSWPFKSWQFWLLLMPSNNAFNFLNTVLQLLSTVSLFQYKLLLS